MMPADLPVLQTADLSIGYRSARKSNIVVAKHLDLSLNAGELVALMGPNGVGKSTLLRTIVGQQAPLHGTVTLASEDVHHMSVQQRARKISIVLTERIDAGLLSGYSLVALGRHPYTDWSGRLASNDTLIIQWAIDAVGAAELADRSVSELSDGERQKIMIARALAQEPILMVLDEPTAYLDVSRRVEIMNLLRDLAHQTNKAVLLSTHDFDLAIRLADRIWLMSTSGDIQVGSPEDLILNGDFASVFQGERIQFDVSTGSFEITTNFPHVIQLNGEGVEAIWTKRALERVRYRVSDSDAIAQVDVARNQEALHWTLQYEGKVHEFMAISDLLVAMDERIK